MSLCLSGLLDGGGSKAKATNLIGRGDMVGTCCIDGRRPYEDVVKVGAGGRRDGQEDE